MANLGTRKEQAGIADKPSYISGVPATATGNTGVEMLGTATIGNNVVLPGTFAVGKRIILRCEGVYTAPITTGLVVPLTINIRIGSSLFYQIGFNITLASVAKDFWFDLDITNIGVDSGGSGTTYKTVTTGHLYFTSGATDILSTRNFNSNSSTQLFNITEQMVISVQAFYTLPSTVTAATALTYTITALKAQMVTNF